MNIDTLSRRARSGDFEAALMLRLWAARVTKRARGHELDELKRYRERHLQRTRLHLDAWDALFSTELFALIWTTAPEGRDAKIACVKLVMRQCGATLKEAKALVESPPVRLPHVFPTREAAEALQAQIQSAGGDALLINLLELLEPLVEELCHGA